MNPIRIWGMPSLVTQDQKDHRKREIENHLPVSTDARKLPKKSVKWAIEGIKKGLIKKIADQHDRLEPKFAGERDDWQKWLERFTDGATTQSKAWREGLLPNGDNLLLAATGRLVEADFRDFGFPAILNGITEAKDFLTERRVNSATDVESESTAREGKKRSIVAITPIEFEITCAAAKYESDMAGADNAVAKKMIERGQVLLSDAQISFEKKVTAEVREATGNRRIRKIDYWKIVDVYTSWNDAFDLFRIAFTGMIPYRHD